MKKIFFGLILYHCCLFTNAQGVTAQDFKKLYWLVSEWNRTNAKPGTSGLEKWIKVSDSELQGRGFSLKGADTTFVEKTKLIIKDNSIYYVADVTENKNPVRFKLTRISNNEFTCENPTHDFPKKIKYTKNGLKMKAVISGNGKSIEYLFERKRG